MVFTDNSFFAGDYASGEPPAFIRQVKKNSQQHQTAQQIRRVVEFNETDLRRIAVIRPI